MGRQAPPDRPPARVTGFIIQNANAYVEGVSAACFRALAPLWEKRTREIERAAEDFVSALEPAPPEPERCGQKRSAPATSPRLIGLLEDYRTNVALYPDWQATFREHLPPTLIIRGKHDPVFIPPARAYLADLPQAKPVWLDAGHSVLDQNSAQVAAEIKAALVPRAAVPAIELIARQRAARMYPSFTAR